MAKDLTVMTKEFNNIKLFAAQNVAAVTLYNTQRSQFNRKFGERVKALETRVAEMKQAGQVPTNRDTKINAIIAKLQSFDAVIQKMGGYEKQFRAPLLRRVKNLETLVAAEVTTRGKALSTKLGVGNKSLPGLRQLQEDLEEFKKSTNYTTISKWSLDNDAAWAVPINSAIKKALG